MNREEITNSQDYKATKAALEWWRNNVCKPNAYGEDRSESINLEDAYTEGVIYGWNNPNWISVEDALPKEKQKVLAYFSPNEECEHEYACMALYNYGFHHWEDAEDPGIILEGVTHWMPIVLPRKEE